MSQSLVSTPNWDLIRAFLALERHGSYEVAAEMEGVDDSTLRRRIRQLEQHMGRVLFVRGENGWRTSADLHALLVAAQRMEEAARSFCQNHQAGVGTIRISMMDVLAQRFAPVLATMRQKYPQLIFNVTTETHFVNLEQEQVDIALRLARPERNSNTLRVRKLGDVAIGAYASRDYLGKVSASTHGGHQLLEINRQFFHHDHDFVYARLDWEHFGLSGHIHVRSDSFALLVRLCELGQGLVLLPRFLAAEHPQLLAYPADVFVEAQLWLVSRFDMQALWQRDLANMLQAELARWPQ